MRETHTIRENQRYIIGDAVEELNSMKEEATLICLDDAWARPQRAGQFGVTYETHPFSEKEKMDEDYDGVMTTDIIDACKGALKEGGWLIADADDWLLPRLIDYLQETWGDVAARYKGGGYRRVGSVTYVSKSGAPDRSTAGMYLSNGGYSVVFAHKGETDRRAATSARQLVQGDSDVEDEDYASPFQVTGRAGRVTNYGSTKPIGPYKEWIRGLLDPTKRDEHLVVPCAGTAPAAIGAELLYEGKIPYTCIDIADTAYEAFEVRRQRELTDNSTSQDQLRSYEN